MPEYVPEGALLPSGINIDETAAYFGITDSSQILMEMETLGRHESLTIVLNKISDLLLTDTFDLDSGSNRLQVESGEIYYILSGPLKLLKLTEKLQDYLGLNIEGNTVRPDITDEQFFALEALLDPMNILKIYAIGDVTGGNAELAKYTNAFDEMMQAPAENLENLVIIKNEMSNILIETKNMQMPRSISILKASTPVNVPKIITPQKHVEEKIETQEVNPTTNNISSDLQQPTALKPPRQQTGIIEATPLTKPESLEKPKTLPPNPPIIQKEITTMEDIEKNSLNADSWINTENEISSKSPEEISNVKPIVPKAPPIVPKSKPIQPKVFHTPQIQSQTESHVPETTVQPTPNSNEKITHTHKPQTLPKPKQHISPISNSNTNGIIRTFPNGNICRGCGISMSNSWRFCALCGFNF